MSCAYKIAGHAAAAAGGNKQQQQQLQGSVSPQQDDGVDDDDEQAASIAHFPPGLLGHQSMADCKNGACPCMCVKTSPTLVRCTATSPGLFGA